MCIDKFRISKIFHTQVIFNGDEILEVYFWLSPCLISKMSRGKMKTKHLEQSNFDIFLYLFTSVYVHVDLSSGGPLPLNSRIKGR